jgi:CRISPR-associated protein Cst1
LSEMIAVRLNNFLFNAGVVGFIYLLEQNGVPKEFYKYREDRGNELLVDKRVFTDYDLAEMFYVACQQRFEDVSKWKNMIELMKKIELLDLSSQEGQDQFAALTKARPGNDFGEFSKLDSSSFKTGYGIIKRFFNDDFDCEEATKKARKEKDLFIKREMLRRIISYIEKYPQVLLMKDIMYTKINSIWKDMAFLLKANAGKEVISCYRSSFVDPIKKHLSKNKGKNDLCIECGEPVSKGDAQGMSWIQSGVDYGRKRSYFWNMNPDSFLCPICALVYSCAPLGFVFAARSGNAVFINNNISITDLISDNQGTAQEEFDSVGSVMSALTTQLIQKSINLKTRELDNIQVVIYRNDRYEINIIPKKKLEVLKNCQNSFEALIKVFVKLKEESIAIYEEVLHNFLFGINQYNLINTMLRYPLDSIRFLRHILKIQIYTRGEMKVSEEEKKEFNRVRMMASHGNQLRKELSDSHRNESVDNTIRSLVYQLLNSLETRDSHRFFDVIARTYTGNGLQIPKLFINMFEHEETFLNLGYAFVFGLKGEDWQTKTENNEKGAAINE